MTDIRCEPCLLRFDRRLLNLKMPYECSCLVEQSFLLFGLIEALLLLFSNINEIFTSTAKITDDEVTKPTEQSPFLTAYIAYSTWKRCPFGENTVIAVSYI